MTSPTCASSTLSLTYDRYLDQVWGGWFGKSLGGAIGAYWEGHKGWIDITEDEALPAQLPPNDDLDLQVLWLGVVEQYGPRFRASDLAEAWVQGCWYPFNEYGTFRKNYRLGIPPPYTAQADNAWWETGMGCPIRSEVWGYLCPGAPDLAADYAALDGALDHTAQSVGAEQLFSAMAADAFFIGDLRRLLEKHLHYLPVGTPIQRLTATAIAAHDAGLTLAEARERVLLTGGNPEACDAMVNVPFTVLGLLYGEGDLWKTILACLHLGFDTDCTCATAGAFIGQLHGYRAAPARWKTAIGDDLVMGIEYRRPEMTLSALARDTARAGALISQTRQTGVTITEAPALAPWPATIRTAPAPLRVDYPDGLAIAPGEAVRVTLTADPAAAGAGSLLTVEAPAGWQVIPAAVRVSATAPTATVTLQAPADPARWPMSHRFTARLAGSEEPLAFALLGAALWQLLGVYHEPYSRVPDTHTQQGSRCPHCLWTASGDTCVGVRCNLHLWVDLQAPYLADEAAPDAAACAGRMARVLGRRPLLAARTQRVPLEEAVQFTGQYCAYLQREMVSPTEQDVKLLIGHTDGFRLYLNGELLVERDEALIWAPHNTGVSAHLRAGVNRLVVKLLKRTDTLTFTLGIRGANGNSADHVIDLEDVVPTGW